MKPKPRIYIAAPLFNSAQINLIQRIEDRLDKCGIPYFSPRIESEPFMPLPQDRKNASAWEPVFDCNIRGLRDSSILLAVLNYSLPEEQQVGLASYVEEPFEHHVRMASFKPLELPDTGTIWEMGYFLGKGKIVVGFHPEKKAEHLNVMLTHGCDGLISGWNNLDGFFMNPHTGFVPPLLSKRMAEMLPLTQHSVRQELGYFDWSCTAQWAAQQDGEV